MPKRAYHFKDPTPRSRLSSKLIAPSHPLADSVKEIPLSVSKLKAKKLAKKLENEPGRKAKRPYTEEKVKGKEIRAIDTVPKLVRLEAQHYRAIEFLMTRGPRETMKDIAARIGVVRNTLYRWLSDPLFVRRYQERLREELGGERGRVMRALIDGALRPGSNQAAMQKIFWQMCGELRDRVELTGKDGGPVTVQQSPIALDQLPIEAQEKMLAILTEYLGKDTVAGYLTAGEEAEIFEEGGKREEEFYGEGRDGNDSGGDDDDDGADLGDGPIIDI